LQYLDLKGGLSLSFDFAKGQPAPAATPIPAAAPLATPTATAVSAIVTIPVSPTSTFVPLNTPTPVMTSAPIDTLVYTPLTTAQISSDESKVKIYYRAGMKAFDAHQYKTAIKNFKKAIAVNDRFVQKYYYAESNAMLGVIYQFHLPAFTGHNKIAVIYYKRALKIDPMTKSAKKYLAMLQPSKKARKKPAAAVTASAPSEFNAATTTGSAPMASNNTQSIDLDTSTAPTAQQPVARTTPAN